MNAQTHAMIFRGAVGAVTTVRVKVIKSTEMDRHRNLFSAKSFSSNVQATAQTAFGPAKRVNRMMRRPESRDQIQTETYCENRRKLFDFLEFYLHSWVETFSQINTKHTPTACLPHRVVLNLVKWRNAIDARGGEKNWIENLWKELKKMKRKRKPLNGTPHTYGGEQKYVWDLIAPFHEYAPGAIRQPRRKSHLMTFYGSKICKIRCFVIYVFLQRHCINRPRCAAFVRAREPPAPYAKISCDPFPVLYSYKF